jgi:UDP-N-acetylmuramyl pentapeptide phosphotransferase/UDP-N-acetylglucosamine-1-phosphate transferase
LGAGLAVVSWIDDVRDLPPAPRFLSHIVAVAVVLILLPDNLLVFQGWLPLALDRIAAGLAWVWFINLYNFMDGIDGITGVETISIGAGLTLIAALGGGMTVAGVPVTLLGLSLAGAAVGFLIWNWHPARIFMGDVGSVPIGFLAGWLLIATAANGAWAAALILPAYYLADATITLIRRARRLEPIWRAHREHFYQKAIGVTGGGHNRVATMIGGLNLVLIADAVLSTHRPLLALSLAAAATTAILFLFSRMGRAPLSRS